ncbi:MAG: signal peptide peptidase SppA [Gammaproteobacteria bacterium]|nr:signal peptide peptidase SppA [Gammaproteobacteria bacterium]
MTSTKKSFLGRLFGGLWSIVVGLYRAIVILSLVLLLAVAWMALRGGPPIKVERNVALVIYPTGELVETVDRDAGQLFLEELSGEQPSQTRVRDLVEALDEGARDPRIALAVVKLDQLWAAGLPQLDELAAAVRRFRESGKPVYAHGPYYEQGHYLVAAQADHVSLDPMGSVELLGFGVYDYYFKDALDKLGVEINVFRVGEYKAAVEPFERNDMSEQARQANAEWLGDLWRRFGGEIARARKLPDGAVDRFVSGMADGLAQAGGHAAAYARDARLVDALETLDQFRTRVGAVVGMDEDHGSFRQIHHTRYLHALQRERHEKPAPDHTVALVVVQGEIVDGDSQPGLAGGDTIADLLDEARRDEAVDAVVLRVDSPGGSVYASERIRRQVRALKEAGKPVVASMSSVAASGGYWVSMDADEIWAHDTTITGSIGIFALWPTFHKPLEKLGIHTDGLGTTPLAGAFRGDRPIAPDAARIIQSQIEFGYRSFIDGVASGRELPRETVDRIARGRVWSGEDAKVLGLVDEIGGLDGAVAAAARLANLQEGEYRLEEIQPPQELPIEALIRFAGEARLSLFGSLGAAEAVLRPVERVARHFAWIDDPRGVYAHCFCRPAVSTRWN